MEGYIGLCSEAKWSIVTAEPQLMAGYIAVAITKQTNENEKKKKKGSASNGGQIQKPCPQ